MVLREPAKELKFLVLHITFPFRFHTINVLLE